jgi:hypothetical protein
LRRKERVRQGGIAVIEWDIKRHWRTSRLDQNLRVIS